MGYYGKPLSSSGKEEEVRHICNEVEEGNRPVEEVKSRHSVVEVVSKQVEEEIYICKRVVASKQVEEIYICKSVLVEVGT